MFTAIQEGKPLERSTQADLTTDLKGFVKHLQERARLIAPDYPGVNGPLSHWEFLWAITSTCEGIDAANKECHAYIARLRAALRKLVFYAEGKVSKEVIDAVKAEITSYYVEPRPIDRDHLYIGIWAFTENSIEGYSETIDALLKTLTDEQLELFHAERTKE